VVERGSKKPKSKLKPLKILSCCVVKVEMGSPYGKYNLILILLESSQNAF
jgi:hypothetical protein